MIISNADRNYKQINFQKPLCELVMNSQIILYIKDYIRRHTVEEAYGKNVNFFIFIFHFLFWMMGTMSFVT